MKKFILFTFVVLFLLSLTEAYAGEKHNSDEWQIKAYSSAAPSIICDFATIIGGDGKKLMSCFVIIYLLR